MADSGTEAVANARRYQSYAVGMCLRFVRAEAWQIGSLYGSAIDAWYGARHRHPGDRHPPLGAPMFYAGGRYGHIVVNTNTGRIRSTDCYTTGRVSEAVTDWPVTTWGQTYLGWTEDLNGVDLPLGEGEEEEMKPEEWDKLRRIVREEVTAELTDQKSDYVKSFLAGKVDDHDPEPTTVKKALRLSADHARD